MTEQLSTHTVIQQFHFCVYTQLETESQRDVSTPMLTAPLFTKAKAVDYTAQVFISGRMDKLNMV